MDEDEPQEVNFVDIAQRRSEVLIDVNPSRLLLLSHRYQDPKTKRQVDCQLLRSLNWEIQKLSGKTGKILNFWLPWLCFEGVSFFSFLLKAENR